MEIREIGEFGLIDRLKENTICTPELVDVGIGDDCAVVRHRPGTVQLLTTDMLVENVHFTLLTTTPQELGYKAIAVNISDIAAMGGTPRHALLSIALPSALPVEFVVALYEGMKEICREFGVNIVGGDTVSSPGGLVINVAVTGDAPPEAVILRSGARPGDVVAVSGPLGDSAAGLELLLAGRESVPGGEVLKERHRKPRPRADIGARLASAGVTSMNDISDGLSSELQEIASPSGVDIIVASERIPFSPELQAAAEWMDRDLLHYALYGGEDFQLLFTLPEDRVEAVEAAIGAKIHIIGVVESGTGRNRLRLGDGTCVELRARGYNHFHKDVDK